MHAFLLARLSSTDRLMDGSMAGVLREQWGASCLTGTRSQHTVPESHLQDTAEHSWIAANQPGTDGKAFLHHLQACLGHVLMVCGAMEEAC